MTQRSRNYCFTDFELIDLEKLYIENKDIIRYICWGEEIAPTTGKKHYQGWIQFYNPKRFGSVKKLLGKKIHIEKCKGNEYNNDIYCKKDNNFKKYGKFIKQGQRTDLENIKKNIDNGATKKEIMDNNFETYCRYRNGINDYIKEVNKVCRSNFRNVNVEYVFGETGTGKTKYGMSMNPFKIEADNLKWWDGYDGEKTILIDEYDNQVNITKMLNLLDGYKLRLPIKGGFTYANWNKVIITSNLKPKQLHKQAKEAHRKALFRRINNIIEMTQSGPRVILKPWTD